MHRMLVLALLATALVPSVDAQIPPTGTLAGTVCTQAPWEWEPEGCYEPLPGATVRIEGGALAAGLGAVDRTQDTDESGWFSFDNIPEGEYEVTVSRAGFEGAKDTVDVAGHVEVQYAVAGQPVDIDGQVFDPDGKPVRDAYVHGWGADRYFEAQTAADGRFSFESVAGWHSVQVRAPGLKPADLYELLDGSDLSVELEALPPPDLFISGTVEDKDGDPVPQAEVRFYQYAEEFGEFENWTRTQADGSYRLGAYVGDGSLMASKDGFTRQERWLYVEDDTQHHFRILEVPPKTARLVGSVVDAVTGDPVHNVRISLQLPEYGLWECTGRGDAPEAMPMEDIAYSSSRYQEPDCAIRIDGASFSGNVTPGYAVLEAWHDRWADCPETRSSDGTSSRDCGPGYYSYTQTVRLDADADNAIQVSLRPRPSADSTVSGYVLDEASGEALAGARISFWNQERDGWGEAVTDDDGSYAIRLVSGYHRVNVWADGHLQWEGVLDVPADAQTPFDVRLVEGEATYGGCCYAYEVAYASHDSGGASHASAEISPAPRPAGGGGGGGQGGAYEDLGGGLGPYDPASRDEAQGVKPAGQDSPAPLVLAVLAAVAVALLRRR